MSADSPVAIIVNSAGTNVAEVKAASTAAVAADPALVVAVSPNNTPVLPSGAATSALQTQPGVDIGDVTINNASGGSAVNIQDGGNSITVDAPVGTPVAARLSDGSSFYDATKTGQLPTALVGGRLDTNTGAWLGSTVPTVGQKAMVDSIPVVVSSDQTPIPVGLKLYLDNAQVFSVSTSLNMASGGTDNPLILFRNPAASGKTAYVWRVQGGTAISNVAVVFRLFDTPTVTTTGSAMTVAKRKIGSGTAVVTPFSLPTVSSTGTQSCALVQGQNSTSVIFGAEFLTAVPENKDLLLTGAPASNNRAAAVSIIWIEV